MTEEIYEGKNVLSKSYIPPNKGVNIDVWIDNSIRSDCFGKALLAIFSKEKMKK